MKNQNNEIREVGKVVLVRVNQIRPFPNQPRTYFNQRSLRALADSIKEHGQIKEGLVKRVDGESCMFQLIDGQRRWHAIQMAGLKRMKVVVADQNEVATEFDQFIHSVISNFGSEGHTPIEIAKAIKRCQDQGLTLDNIAKMFVKSIGWVEQHLKILKLVPEVLEMMSPELPKEERLVYSVAIEIACLPPNRQLPVAKIIMMRNMKLNTARNFIRDQAQEAGIHLTKGRKRKPADDFQVFKSFIRRLSRESSHFDQRGESFYPSILERRSEEDFVYAISDIQNTREALESIVKKLRLAMEKKRGSQATKGKEYHFSQISQASK